MCHLYSLTKGQQAIRDLTRAMHDRTGNLPPLPGIYPDSMAPVVRNGPDGRELLMMRWGMPGPSFAGGAPVTNIRNTTSPHWRRWLSPEQSLPRADRPHSALSGRTPDETYGVASMTEKRAA